MARLQMLSCRLELAIVQCEFGLRAAMHGLECVGGKHLRISGQHLQRFATTFDVSSGQRGVHEQAQQLASPLS